MAEVARRRTGATLLLVWTWAMLALPLVHGLQHHLPHVHGPFGTTYFFGARADHFDEVRRSIQCHEGHISRAAQPQRERRHCHALAEHSRGAAEDGLPQAREPRHEHGSVPADARRAAPRDHDEHQRDKPDPAHHGQGAPEHFGAVFSVVDMNVGPATSALATDVWVLATDECRPAFESLRRVLWCRGPPLAEPAPGSRA